MSYHSKFIQVQVCTVPLHSAHLYPLKVFIGECDPLDDPISIMIYFASRLPCRDAYFVVFSMSNTPGFAVMYAHTF
jgi:hypothetical protein